MKSAFVRPGLGHTGAGLPLLGQLDQAKAAEARVARLADDDVVVVCFCH
jgi:hypothetical protein